MQLLHARCLERNRANEHRIEANTSAPHINLETLIALILQNLWCDVGWCTTLLWHSLCVSGDLSWDTEICYLDFSIGVKKNVIQFNVTMHNQLWMMQVCEPFNQLFEEVFGNLFSQLPSLADICQKVATCAELHHEAYMLGCLKSVIQPHDTLVVWLLENCKFLHHLLLLLIFSSIRYGYLLILVWFRALKKFFVDRFNSYQLFTHFMCGQVYFTESTSAQNTANSIEFWRSCGWLAEFTEIKLYQLLQFIQVFAVRGHIGVSGEGLILLSCWHQIHIRSRLWYGNFCW